MKIERLPSGLLVPADKAPAPKPPPEHPSRADIRIALRTLDTALRQYEQTTHATMKGSSIEAVVRALADCYEKPNAYTISDLSQVIDRFLEQQEPTPQPAPEPPSAPSPAS